MMRSREHNKGENTELTETIQAAMKGDADAFAALYKKYFSTILYYAGSLLDNDEDKYDVAQDAVLKLYTKMKTLKSPYAFYTFMLSVVKNTCLSHNRKMKLRRTEALESADALLTDAETMPEVAYERKELGNQVRASIAKLPEKQRMALFMYYYRGLSYNEIANEMGITIQSVGANITRARQSLAKLLTLDSANDSMPLKHIALDSALVGAFVLELDTPLHAVHIEQAISVIDKELLAGAKTASLTGAGSGLGAGFGGIFGSVFGKLLASVALVVVVVGGIASVATVVPGAPSPEPPKSSWRPSAQIQLESAEGKAGQEDPYRARLIIAGARSMDWEILGAAGHALCSGSGGEVGDVLTELAAGNYTIKWIVKNSSGETVIVKRDFSISPPQASEPPND